LLEIDKEIMIVFLLSKIRLEAFRVVHVIDDRLFERLGRALISYVRIVRFLEFFW
jgi:hypothetical protein